MNGMNAIIMKENLLQLLSGDGPKSFKVQCNVNWHWIGIIKVRKKVVQEETTNIRSSHSFGSWRGVLLGFSRLFLITTTVNRERTASCKCASTSVTPWEDRRRVSFLKCFLFFYFTITLSLIPHLISIKNYHKSTNRVMILLTCFLLLRFPPKILRNNFSNQFIHRYTYILR